MQKLLINTLFLVSIIGILSGCKINDNSVFENKINKINSIDSQWINYNGERKYNNEMITSQFIPFKPSEEYIVNDDVYISYYNNEKFIKTELYEGDKSILEPVDNANGVILSFNKKNKSGIKLVTTD